MTLVVNLFAGPGAGKSTTAALVFAYLKQRGINVEIAHEYAKDLTWEDRHKAIRFQPYVSAKQIWRVHRLLNQVDVVVTDSPILLSMIYKGEGYTKEFATYITSVFRSWDTLNFFLSRGDYKYQAAGRSQTEVEASTIDIYVRQLLDDLKVNFKRVPGGGKGVYQIVSDIEKCLEVS